MRPCTASSCCCQARNLPWAPVPTPHAAARPVNLSWAPVPLLMLLPGPECVMGPWYGLPLLLSLSPHSAMCHFQVSHTAGVVSIFVIGCCMASHCCCLTATLWLHTLVLAP
ncbi:unnamed protein product [Staurois parvus]|uniref:Uncharacterized protein n=1 Tax=Staurois parvus TaxID=386267 RepID=A0ABN9BK61_9NEOB|nr:unnamed protein product [Staurois parvus]